MENSFNPTNQHHVDIDQFTHHITDSTSQQLNGTQSNLLQAERENLPAKIHDKGQIGNYNMQMGLYNASNSNQQPNLLHHQQMYERSMYQHQQPWNMHCPPYSYMPPYFNYPNIHSQSSYYNPNNNFTQTTNFNQSYVDGSFSNNYQHENANTIHSGYVQNQNHVQNHSYE